MNVLHAEGRGTTVSLCWTLTACFKLLACTLELFRANIVPEIIMDTIQEFGGMNEVFW